MQKNISKKIISGAIIFLCSASYAFAIDYTEPTITDEGENYVQDIIGKILTPIWQITAGLSIVMLIITGILFITANGDPSQITKAKTSLIWSIIGIVVAVLAFSIVFIIKGVFIAPIAKP
jgi:hypothetical protein